MTGTFAASSHFSRQAFHKLYSLICMMHVCIFCGSQQSCAGADGNARRLVAIISFKKLQQLSTKSMQQFWSSFLTTPWFLVASFSSVWRIWCFNPLYACSSKIYNTWGSCSTLVLFLSTWKTCSLVSLGNYGSHCSVPGSMSSDLRFHNMNRPLGLDWKHRSQRWSSPQLDACHLLRITVDVIR